MSSYLLLKWGTLKGWDFEGKKRCKALVQELYDIGVSESCMLQKDTNRQKEILCELIDLVDEIENDWTGEKMNKYVLNYGK